MNLKLIIKQITEFNNDPLANIDDQIIVDGNGTRFERFKIHQYAKKCGLISTTATEETSINKYIIISKKPSTDLRTLIPTNQCIIDEITISDEMIWTFINLTKCPIPVPKPEFIEYFLKMLDPYLGSYGKFIEYIHEVKRCGGIGKYRKHIDEITRAIVDYIKTDCGFDELRNCLPGTISDRTVPIVDRQENNLSRDFNRLKKTIYKAENNNKIMISIDLIDAFFKLTKYNYPTTFEGKSQWDQYISKYTDYQFLIESKILRKIILGKSGLGRQMTEMCNRYMDMVGIDLNKVIERESALSIINVNLDEIVFEVKNPTEDIKYYENFIRSYVDEMYPNMFRTQMFKLHQLKDTLCFVKEYGDDKCRFKCCHPMVLLQCIKYWKKQECVPNDFKYLKDGNIIDHPIVFE